MQYNPTGIAVSETGVYWLDQGPGTVMGMLVDGGNLITLAGGQGYTAEVMVNAHSVLWSSEPPINGLNTLAITAVPIDGGISEEIVAEPTGSTWFAMDSANVYWAFLGEYPDAGGDLIPGTGEIFAAPIDGGTPIVLVSGQNEPIAIAVDAEHLYWTNAGTLDAGFADGAIMKAQLDGGAVTVLAGPRSEPIWVAVDSTNIYWFEQFINVPYGTGADGGAIVKVGLDGGTPVVLASHPAPYIIHGLATDGTKVYWTDYGSYDGNGQVLSVSVDGGAVTPIAQDQHLPFGVAVDATSVYWTNEGTSAEGLNDGAVMKATPK